MMIALFNWFVKITGWPVQFLCFRTKILYEDRKVQGRHVKGSAIILSNHTSVFDYAVYLFVFFTRTLRFQMAEVLFEKPLLGLFLKCLGNIPRPGRAAWSPTIRSTTRRTMLSMQSTEPWPMRRKT